MSLIRALMIDVEGVLVCGRPSDGRPWASTIEDDLGLSVAALQQEFFSPYWNEIVLGRAAPVDHLKPVLAKIAPHLLPIPMKPPLCSEMIAPPVSGMISPPV